MARLSILVLLFVLVSVALPAQQPAQQTPVPPGTASLDGTVLAMGTNQPIAGAYVEMRRTDCNNFGASPETVNATSGPDGRFSLQKLHAGNWCLGAVRAGGAYAPVEYQQRSVKGRGVSIPIADGQKLTGIQLTMPQTGSISGRVVDSDGEPMGHVRVQVLEAFYHDGQRRLYTLNIVQTNDLGQFSHFWLPPGQYFITAIPEEPTRQQVVFSVAPPGLGGHRTDAMAPIVTKKISENGEIIEETYMPVYFGGGTDPLRAQPIDVRPGFSTNIELSFSAANMRTYHIRGRLQNGAGGPAASAQLRLAPRNWSSLVLMPFATTDADGNFDIAGVVPGDYVLYANGTAPNPNVTVSPAQAAAIAAGRSGSPMMAVSGRFPLTVGNGDVEGVGYSLTAGYTFPGVFLIEGSDMASMPAAFRTLRVVLTRDPDIIGIQQQGTFTGTAQPANNVNAQLLLQGLNIQTLDSATLQALLQASNTQAQPTPAGAPGAPQPTTVDNTFRIQNAGAGDYRVYVPPLVNPFQWGTTTVPQAMQNFYVKSIRLGSADVLTDGLHLGASAPDGRMEVVIGIGGKLDGTVTSDRGDAAANVTVVLVPDLRYRQRSDLYRSASTDSSGKFQLQGIAPGDYEAFAWEEIPDGAWQETGFMRNYEGRGKRVRIASDIPAHVEISVIPAGR